MANHNQLKRISSTYNPNTIVYADENGHISNWLDNDPVIQSLKQQTEFIGSVSTAPSPDTQEILNQFVIDTAGRQPRNGDEVSILDVGELWLFNGTSWAFFTNTTIAEASTTTKGVMQVGTGLSASNGVVSVDSTIYWPARTTVSSSSLTPSLALQSNTDYTFTDALSSLTLTSIPSSPYYITLTFITANGFTLSVPNGTKFYFIDTPTFSTGVEYKIIIRDGVCQILYVGQVGYAVTKKTFLNGSGLTPDSNNIITWTVTHNLGTKDIIVRMYKTTTGESVDIETTTSTLSQVEVKFSSEDSPSSGTYTLVIIG